MKGTEKRVAGNLAMAAVQSAALNVKVNAAGLADTELADRWGVELLRLETSSDEYMTEIRRQLSKRAQID